MSTVKVLDDTTLRKRFDNRGLNGRTETLVNVLAGSKLRPETMVERVALFCMTDGLNARDFAALSYACVCLADRPRLLRAVSAAKRQYFAYRSNSINPIPKGAR